MEDFEGYINQASENIEKDRKRAIELLAGVMTNIKEEPEAHVQLGPIAAKYLETLQRSNEQLVKIASIVQKQQSEEGGGLSSDGYEDIFNTLQSEIDEQRQQDEALVPSTEVEATNGDEST